MQSVVSSVGTNDQIQQAMNLYSVITKSCGNKVGDRILKERLRFDNKMRSSNNRKPCQIAILFRHLKATHLLRRVQLVLLFLCMTVVVQRQPQGWCVDGFVSNNKYDRRHLSSGADIQRRKVLSGRRGSTNDIETSIKKNKKGGAFGSGSGRTIEKEMEDSNTITDNNPYSSKTPMTAEVDEEDPPPEEDTDANTSSAGSAPLTLKQQAEALREEALLLEKQLAEAKLQREIEENAKVDGWIEDLFVQYQIDDTTQMLNDVEQVVQRLQDDRYSQEQVNKIYKRICETSGGVQSRSSCSPIMALLVDAAGKLDCVDKKDNPNKRWSGKVERLLRKRLFAKDWGIELEEDDDDDSKNPWNLFR